jgi:DNA polymerase III sliding clamp (beta) subunit (PCNA family)
MLAELRFVQGSVAKKDFLPALTHFVIEGGRVRGFNGTIALCSPIACDLNCKPKAEPLVKAIGNCNDTIALSMTPAGKLRIHSGAFKALIECIPPETETPHAEPEGGDMEIDGAALQTALKHVEPFVGDDASRAWATGVLVRGQFAHATNNVCLVQYWMGNVQWPEINIPRAAVKEIVRIKEAPIRAQLTPRSLTLHYSSGRWIRTQLLETKWPDLDSILARESKQEPIDPKIFEGLSVIRPFVDKLGRVFFQAGGMSTHEGGSENEGASFELDGWKHEGVYNLEIIRLLEESISTIDWSLYPKPCIFYGAEGMMRGALIGMRK